MRFPHDGAVIVDDGNLAVWIHSAELGRVQSAEPPTRLNMLVWQFEFFNQPHYLLQIERTAAPPDCQHMVSPLRAAPRITCQTRSEVNGMST